MQINVDFYHFSLSDNDSQVEAMAVSLETNLKKGSRPSSELGRRLLKDMKLTNAAISQAHSKMVTKFIIIPI